MQMPDILRRALRIGQAIQQEADKGKRWQLEKELHDFLMSLTAAEVYMVITVMYLGRGDFGVAGLMDGYEDMSDTFDKPADAINQMLEKTAFAEYLQAGLERLSEARIDLESLLTTHFDTPLATLENGEGVELCTGPRICDACGKPIEQPKDGMLQWLTRCEENRTVGRDMRVVHHRTASPLGGRTGCYPDETQELRRDGSTLSDVALDRMLGPDGLVRLLALVEDGKFAPHDVSRIIMRLFVPGYEQARAYFQRALATGVVDERMPDDYFFQHQLRRIVANRSRLDS